MRPDGFEDLPILGELRERWPSTCARRSPRRVRRPGDGRPAGRWALAGVGRAGLALAVAVALAVVAVGLVALHHRTGGPRPRGPAGHGTSPSASPSGPRLRSSPVSIGPHASRRSPATTPVLSPPATGRRPSRDRPRVHVVGPRRAPTPTVTARPHRQGRRSLGWPTGGGVFVNYLRRARTEYGRSYWLIPEARATRSVHPARCYREFRATLERDLRHASPVERDRALRAQQEQLGAERLQSEHRQGLCFVAIGLSIPAHVPAPSGFGCSAAPTSARPIVGGNGSGDRGGGTIQRRRGAGRLRRGERALPGRRQRSGAHRHLQRGQQRLRPQGPAAPGPRADIERMAPAPRRRRRVTIVDRSGTAGEAAQTARCEGAGGQTADDGRAGAGRSGSPGCQYREVAPVDTETLTTAALERLRALTADPDADIRPGQLEAIHDVVADRARVLCVQRTGWGKSAVYFVARRCCGGRRGADAHRQPAARAHAQPDRGGATARVRAHTINSTNREEWNSIRDLLARTASTCC